MGYGEKIAALRKKHGMTQTELGGRLNVTYQAVSKWERNESEPDFATMSKMAKLFGVTLSYFEEASVEELASTTDDVNSSSVVHTAEPPAATAAPTPAPAPAPAAPERQMVGMCTSCGRILYKDDVKYEGGKMFCGDCHRKVVAAKQAKEQKERQARAAAAEELRSKRRRGFWVGGIVTAVVLAIMILAMTSAEKGNLGAVIGGGLVVTVLTFFTVPQLFWDGIVAHVAFAGGLLVGTPGVIFSLDLDGLIFLVAVKILFAVLRFIIFLLTFLVCFIVAMFIAPFSFFPALFRINREIASV